MVMRNNAESRRKMEICYEFGELNLFQYQNAELSRQPIHVYPYDVLGRRGDRCGHFAFSDLNGSEFHHHCTMGESNVLCAAGKRSRYQAGEKFWLIK